MKIWSFFNTCFYEITFKSVNSFVVVVYWDNQYQIMLENTYSSNFLFWIQNRTYQSARNVKQILVQSSKLQIKIGFKMLFTVRIALKMSRVVNIILRLTATNWRPFLKRTHEKTSQELVKGLNFGHSILG